MSLFRRFGLSCVLSLSVGACGDGDAVQQVDAPVELVDPGEGAIVQEEPAPIVPDAIGLPCDVKIFLATNCQGCHSAEAKNGTPLLTRDDLLVASKKEPTHIVAERIALRIGEPEKPMPPKGKGTPVTAADLEMFLGWLDHDMPAGRCDL